MFLARDEITFYDVTLDEMNCMLQLQIQQQSQMPQPDLDGTGSESEDEIDAALTDLQVSLEGSAVSATGDITRTPELHGYIRFFKYDFQFIQFRNMHIPSDV